MKVKETNSWKKGKVLLRSKIFNPVGFSSYVAHNNQSFIFGVLYILGLKIGKNWIVHKIKQEECLIYPKLHLLGIYSSHNKHKVN